MNKISPHMCTINENEGESGYKNRGATNAFLAIEGAHRHPFINDISMSNKIKGHHYKPLLTGSTRLS